MFGVMKIKGEIYYNLREKLVKPKSIIKEEE